MGSSHDYALLEFAKYLAEVERNFSKQLQDKIDTFVNSRLDLPLKRLSEIAKIHKRAGRNLEKMLDPKKNDHLNLWKMCNIYSALSVDLDKAMRDTRAVLRDRIDDVPTGKTKKRTIFENLLTIKNGETYDHKPWLKRFTKEERERRHEMRSSRKNTGSSLELEKEEPLQTKSTPPTPQATRSTKITRPNIPTPSVTVESPIRPRACPPPIPSTQPPPIPPPIYATTVYSEMQKSSDNRPEEHSLRYTDAMSQKMPIVRIRTDVDVSKETSRNEAITNIYDTNAFSPYVNIRPPLSQKPKLILPENSSESSIYKPLTVNMRETEIPPTFISVDCSSAIPTPSPRNYFNSSEAPSSQRSSSSAYSSNYSTSSSSNVTSLNIDSMRPPSELGTEHARMIRIESPHNQRF